MFVSNAEIQLREMRNPREQTQIQFFSFSFVAITSKEFSEKFWFLNSMLDAQWFFGCQLERIVYFLLHRPRFRTAWMNEKKKSIHFAQSFPQHFPLYAHFYTLIYRWRNYERAYKVYCEIYFLLTSFHTFRGLRWIAAMKFCGKCAHHNKCEKICVSNEITALLLSC